MRSLVTGHSVTSHTHTLFNVSTRPLHSRYRKPGPTPPQASGLFSGHENFTWSCPTFSHTRVHCCTWKEHIPPSTRCRPTSASHVPFTPPMFQPLGVSPPLNSSTTQCYPCRSHPKSFAFSVVNPLCSLHISDLSEGQLNYICEIGQ